jgi:hypothetical protein
MEKLKKLVQEAENLLEAFDPEEGEYTIEIYQDRMGKKTKQIIEHIENHPKIMKKHGIEAIHLLQHLVKKLKEVKK